MSAFTSTPQEKEPSRGSRSPIEAWVRRWPGKAQKARPSVTANIKARGLPSLLQSLCLVTENLETDYALGITSSD